MEDLRGQGKGLHRQDENSPVRKRGLRLDARRLCRVQVPCPLSPAFLICLAGMTSLSSQAALGIRVPRRTPGT